MSGTVPRELLTAMDTDGDTVRVFNGRSWVIVAELNPHAVVNGVVLRDQTAGQLGLCGGEEEQ